jgi:hypothetical protein
MTGFRPVFGVMVVRAFCLATAETMVGFGVTVMGFDWNERDTPATLRVGVVFAIGFNPGLRAISWETEVGDDLLFN